MKSSFKNNMEKTGFVTLTMTVGDKQFCFLVDTGSNQNSLSTSAFEEVKNLAKEVSRITIYGFEGVPYDQLLVEVPYQCGVMTAKDHFFIMSDSPFNSLRKNSEYASRAFWDTLSLPAIKRRLTMSQWN